LQKLYFPPIGIPEHLVSSVRYFLYDEQTAVPYFIMMSARMTETKAYEEQGVF
jgi:hypothetical protein